jgi:integrase
MKLIAYISKCKQIAGFTPDLFLFGIDRPLSTSTLERKRNNYCQQANIQKINIHAFRHSHVSLLINNGFNVFDIAKRLGHSSDMVNNTYGHWFKKNQEKLVNRLDRIQDEAKNNSAVMN